MKKTIISVIGKDKVGITAEVAAVCQKNSVNIIDISQSIMQDFFVMVMMTEVDKMTCTLADFKEQMKQVGLRMGLDIRVMHEDIFNSMHRI